MFSINKSIEAKNIISSTLLFPRERFSSKSLDLVRKISYPGSSKNKHERSEFKALQSFRSKRTACTYRAGYRVVRTTKASA